MYLVICCPIGGVKIEKEQPRPGSTRSGPVLSGRLSDIGVWTERNCFNNFQALNQQALKSLGLVASVEIETSNGAR